MTVIANTIIKMGITLFFFILIIITQLNPTLAEDVESNANSISGRFFGKTSLNKNIGVKSQQKKEL